MFDVANVLKNLTVKDVPMSDYEHARLLIPYVLEQGLYPISSGEPQVLICSPNIYLCFWL